MAKFIELPYGNYNKESQSFERTQMLVNLDRVIKIAPEGETACKVTLAGGNVALVYRRYDTLMAQIMNRYDLAQIYPEEEVAAAFNAGYEKAKAEINPSESKKKQMKRFCQLAAEWFESNPLGIGWQGKFKKAMAEALNVEEE